jgi:predicted RNA-binding protein YlqC (UPF0109 family)
MPRNARTYINEYGDRVKKEKVSTPKFREYEDECYNEEELLNEWRQESKITAKVKIPQGMMGLLIGKEGVTMQRLRCDTNCGITLASGSIVLEGHRDDVAFAAALVKKRLTAARLAADEEVILHVDVVKSSHGKFIGRQGSRVKDLKARLTRAAETGTAKGDVVHGIKVVIPRPGDHSSVIAIHVPKQLADTAENIIKDFFTAHQIQHLLVSIAKVDKNEPVKGGASSTPTPTVSAATSASSSPQPAAHP